MVHRMAPAGLDNTKSALAQRAVYAIRLNSMALTDHAILQRQKKTRPTAGPFSFARIFALSNWGALRNNRQHSGAPMVPSGKKEE